MLQDAGVDCEVRLASGEVRCGAGEPRFRITFHSDRALGRGIDEFALGRAYVEGEMDIEGDVWSLLEVRSRLAARTPLLLA